jgi:Ca2+-binding RTX toxin-like protein
MNKNSRCRRKFQSSTYEKLEAKNLLASIYHNVDTGVLYIGGDSGSNVGQVSLSNGTVSASIDGVSFSEASSEITDIVFIGYDGDDTFTNLSSLSTTMYGQLGNDTLIGGSGDDDLVGGSGNDTIQGLEGDDRIVGANGNDTLEGGDGNDRMFGTAGTNTIYGGAGNDTIYGSPDVDEIYGEGGADKIYALGGDDIIYTGSGGVEGGTFAQGDLAMGHGGDDTFFGSSGLDIFYGGDGDDIMTGGSGENRMHGQAGNDTLTGGGKGDYMTGAGGNDTLEGGGGVDFFNAGDGVDTIVYSGNFNPADVRADASGTRVQNELVVSATWVEFDDRRISASQANNSVQAEINYSTLNGYRVANSEVALSKPSDLSDYALDWSQRMALANRVSNSSVTDQQSLLTGDRTVTAENVGSVADSGQSAVEVANYFHNLWRNNSSDNAVMLRSDLLEVGIGIVKVGDTWWATQIFAG